MIFFTSDLHIGHKYVAMLRYNHTTGDDLTRDDIKDPECAAMVTRWHDNKLAENWDKLVNPQGDRGDQVWVLGDISGGSDKGQRGALAWLMQRRGTKHLITGNHDGAHPMHRDAHRWQREYMGVFDSVQAFARRKIAGQMVLLSHFPYLDDPEADHTGEARYPQWRLPNLGEWLVHGHVHSTTIARNRSIHVGVDAWQFCPLPLRSLEVLITQGMAIRENITEVEL